MYAYRISTNNERQRRMNEEDEQLLNREIEDQSESGMNLNEEEVEHERLEEHTIETEMEEQEEDVALKVPGKFYAAVCMQLMRRTLIAGNSHFPFPPISTRAPLTP